MSQQEGQVWFLILYGTVDYRTAKLSYLLKEN